ncbi:MAG: hypothetical protein GC160_24890 [Acidobacteria bacterium]|nr:hypothetical protein [Acidobacteriota bacterium]
MTHKVLQLLALGALAVCLASSWSRFQGGLSDQDFKSVFLAGTIGWFAFATAASGLGKRQ